MASNLMTWERMILRKIYGPKCEQKVWRIRSNLELQNMYKSPDIMTEIEVRRLEPTKKWYLMLNQKAGVELEDLD
jgi:hypothetical protein